MQAFLQSLLEWRPISDSILLGSEKPLWEWLILIIGGFAMGLSIARAIWYQKIVEDAVEEKEEEAIDFRFRDIVWGDFLPPSPAQSLAPSLKATVKPATAQPRVIPEPIEPKTKPDPNTPIFHPIIPVSDLPIDDKNEEKPPRHTIYLMDVSLSVKPHRLERCKADLKKAISELPPRDKYQVIFFSGAAWFAHQEMIEGGTRNQPVVIRDDASTFRWNYRIKGGYQFSKGNDNLPVGTWLDSTEENRKTTLEHIERIDMSFGTSWHLPFMLAMNLNPVPDHIYFLTDGETVNQDVVASGIVEMVHQLGNETIVDTRGLGTSAVVEKHLERISLKTGGNFAAV